MSMNFLRKQIVYVHKQANLECQLSNLLDVYKRQDHYYYDDYENERSITEIAERSYIPALTTLLEMVKNNGGAFKV